MGLLVLGTPLGWEDSKKHHEYIKKHGITQFLNIFNKLKDTTYDQFLWGDEVEAILVTMDAEQRRSQIILRAPELLAKLELAAKTLKERDPSFQWNAHFVPEYGQFMIEGTPARPYGGFTTDLRLVEANMVLRRELIESLLAPNERVLTISTFPLMGVGDFVQGSKTAPGGDVCRSLYVPDDIISPHPRFSTLTRNIRTRRGSKVCIRVPKFQDQHTVPAVPPPLLEAGPEADELVDTTKEIHMDAMGFGMGCSCLQVTFQARNLGEARTLYDHLAVLSPIMLALTASTPFLHGHIADTDVRWSTIAQSVDDRTPAERGLKGRDDRKQAGGVINKSRYDSIDSYLSTDHNFKPAYNDLDLLYDQESYDELTKHGIDDSLAKHVAHLFIRDPLVIFDGKVKLDDETCTDHFENLQSTNWQTVRFKPPPANSTIGWRVEFRTMELQLTDFENAAYTVFIALLSRSILFFGLNLYLPISKVDANLKTAHKRDAVRQDKFFFRNKISGTASADAQAGDTAEGGAPDPDAYEEMTMEQIMCGKQSDGFPGMVPVVETYLDMIKCDKNTRRVVDGYLDLIRARASGKLLTTAQWLRKFVSSHPDYKADSVISERLNFHILETCHKITKGALKVPQLLPENMAPQTSDSFSNDQASSSGAPLRGTSFRLNLDAPEDFHSMYTTHLRSSAARVDAQ